MTTRPERLPTVIRAEARGRGQRRRIHVLFDNGGVCDLSLPDAKRAARDPKAAAALLRRFAGRYGAE